MERVLETARKSRKLSPRDELRLLFPGESVWERWGLFPQGQAALKSSGNLSDISISMGLRSCLAIPLRHTIVLPIWLSTTDHSLLRELTLLQLERRGFHGEHEEVAFEYRIIRQEKDRILLAAYVLTEAYPAELCFPKITDYRPASDFWKLPSNQLIIWKELGSITLAFTSEEGVVFSQSAPTGSLTTSFIYEAHCSRLVLEGEKVLPGISGITMLGNFTRQEMDSVATVLNLPLQHLDRPLPHLSPKSRRLVPAPVRLVQNQKNLRRRNRKILGAAAGIYLLLACVFLGQLLWLTWQKKSLERVLAVHHNEVESLQSTSQRWQALEPALLPETYPVEMFFRCTRFLPEEGVRLITYAQEADHISLTGEAKNAPAAFLFAESLKKSAEVDAYLWEMPAPELLPNDSAHFVIEGRRKDAPAQEK